MKPYDQKNSRELNIAIALSVLVVFVADLATPLGISVWVFYVLPLILCIAGADPGMPIIVAGAATALTVVGFFSDAPGIARWIAQTNRAFGLVTIWALAITARQFLRNRHVIREQAWLRIAQTGLADQMQGDRTLAALGDGIVRFIGSYIDAQVGVIYLKSEDGEFFRFGAYAIQEGAPGIRKSLVPGSGIAGQVIKDEKPRIVSDIPDNYLSISSALGSSPPRQLIVAPAIAEGNVEAILEFAMLRPIGSPELKLFEAVSEGIGMAVRASKYKTRLEVLLEETQRQSEELQAQSEELRVANEELEEQSRRLMASQVQLENQQSELEETNAQLEEQAQTLEEQKLGLIEAQAALSDRAEELSRASQYKSEFLANMSHELRTPLNSSLILAKLLAENRGGSLSPEEVKYAQTIYSAGNDLLELINDILDLSKIEAGKASVDPEGVNIRGMFDQLARTFEPLATQKGLQFSAEIAANTPPLLFTDRQRMGQILRNLVSNAIKFTPRGSVVLKAFSHATGIIGFSVRDTGIGIPSDKQQVIFEAFRQADGSTHRRFGGTGLGLSISQNLAKLLGGSIEVESAPGEGSLFSVFLPQRFMESAAAEAAETVRVHAAAGAADTRKASAKPVPAPPSPPPPPLPIPSTVHDDRRNLNANRRTLLIVEDDERFAEILTDLAHEQGFQSLMTPSAADGIALAIEHRPTAVLLDLHLPDQSGLYVLDQLKHNPATRHIPIHIISAVNDMHTALELGAFGYDLKPVGREELMKALSRIEARLEQPLRRVLIVEDDDRQRESMRQLLLAPDIEIVAVRTASETLEQLRQSVFDCLVMDLGLEDMSGYALLDKMANEEAYSFPPVIIYTGRTLQPVDEQRLQRYSRSIIIKGARSPERLLDEVTLFLHQVESTLPADQQRMLRMVRHRDAALEGRRILVVEDDVRNIFALTSVLEPKGAKLEIARNGKEALAVLEQHAGGPLPVDLVLMDIMMPEMDGITATREIRKSETFGRIPIIALTAKAMPDDREQCIQAGANDYISKPLDVDKLVSLIRIWIPKS